MTKVKAKALSKLIVVIMLVLVTNCARPPTPVCRTSPLPSVIPVSIGETVRWDLENLFDGYNLVFEGVKKDHLEIVPKYTINQSEFDHSYNFTAAKLKEHNRFLALTANNDYTEIVIGTNHPESGIVIDKVLQVENISELHCYDVDQYFERSSNRLYAIIDCGAYHMGQLVRNQFLFVDLQSYKLFPGSRTSDVFVRFNHLVKRRIEIILDPFTQMEYMFRFYTSENVDREHANQTYVEVFMNSDNIMKIQILDVIDHTLLGLPALEIMDFQVHFNYIYLLVKDSGLYQFELTPTQRLQRRSFFPIKMNVNRFFVQQNGFNDDLHLIVSNENTVYQYEWDVTEPPVLVTKYALMGGSVVEDLLMDQNFVIVQVWEKMGEELERRTWVFSRRTLSYMNAFGSFKEPNFGPSIILYQPFDRTLHLIHQYRSYNIKMNLPYLLNRPVASSKAGDTEQYIIKATSSTGQNGTKTECRITLNFLYIENNDTRIIKTGLQGRNQTFVDAPDDAEYNLQYEFFGRNISYNVITNNVDNKTNSTVVPQSYVEKYTKATLNFPPEIDQKSIVYYQIFREKTLQDPQDLTEIFGIVQIEQTDKSFPIFYIQCYVQMDAQFTHPILKCRTVTKSNLSQGKIKLMSQMYSENQRLAAIIFSNNDVSVYLYLFSKDGFEYFGHKTFGYNYENMMTGAEVTMKGQLIVTFEFGKRLEVYRVEDIRHDQEKPAVPLITINSRIMAFFGVNYFAPVKTKVSIYHDEVTFVQTKTGVMAININEMGLPELLFNIKTPSSRYGFEVNKDTLVIVAEQEMSMYRLTRPLRRREQPFLLQKFTKDFNLDEYDEINSDGLFYLVEKQDQMLLVVHPNMPSTSVIYVEFFIGNIKMIDAVRIKDKEVIFVFNGTHMLSYMFAENPKLRIRWQPDQPSFTMNVSAFNEKSRSEPYSTLFSILDSNQAYINTTDKFNPAVIRKLGYVQTKKSNKKIVDLNITLNDTEWFTGNVMYYRIKCPHCNQNTSDNTFQIHLQNHIKQLNTEIKIGEPVYDMHATYNGIYGQMFNALFKTFANNDSIQYVVNIPTKSRGEVCTKLLVNNAQDYVLSFCQSGTQVNVYITTSASVKPFTTGPFPTEAQACNHVELANNVVMIVDNDDDPFNRAGGVYLYYLDIAAKDPADVLNMLDYLDYADLQIEGFSGIPFIASADIHKPLFNRDEYAVFLTEARTGNIFVFLFQLSSNKQQPIYLQRRMLNLNRLLPPEAKHPTPLRVININIVDYTVRTQTRMRIEYVLLLTVRNWHHIELMFEFDEDYDLLSFQLVRLYERVNYPWELTNYIRLRKGSLNGSYFALSYRNYEQGAQIMAVYPIPYFNLPAEPADPEASIPVTRMLGAHRVLDTAEMAFDFSVKDQHRILFSDANTVQLSELQLNRQLKLIIKNADPTAIQGQNITIIAENHYTNISFMVEFKFNFDKDDDDDDGKTTETEIIWIIILVIGFVVIVGLIFAWSRQKKEPENRDSTAIKESLLTVEPEFKNNFINRSSADPDSVRGTVDYSAPTAEQNKKLQREAEEEEHSDQGQNKEEEELKGKTEEQKV